MLSSLEIAIKQGGDMQGAFLGVQSISDNINCTLLTQKLIKKGCSVIFYNIIKFIKHVIFVRNILTIEGLS